MGMGCCGGKAPCGSKPKAKPKKGKK